MKAKAFKAMAFSVAGVLLALLIILSAAVGAFADVLNKHVVGYKGAGSDSATRAASTDLAEQIQDEGIVLTKNDDGTGNALLPLKKADVPKVNVFGWASTDWVLSGSGSGQVKRAGSVDLLGALTEYGIEYNTELANMYERFRPNREWSIGGSHAGGENDGNPNSSGSLHSFNYEFSRLYEPDIDDTSYYTANLLNNALDFSKTALVVIGRVSGESNDSPAVQYKKGAGTDKTSGKTGLTVDEDRTYLEISTEEEALLEYVGANYENVIVLINSTNVMELGFMDTIPGLDACLITLTTGHVGARSIPKIIYSDLTETDENGNEVNVSVNPSGRTADTWAYDLSTAATYVDVGKGNDTTHFYTNTLNPNFNGSNATTVNGGIYPTNVTHTNGSSTVSYQGAAYEDYRESIYVGYKWYETADTEGFWSSSFANQHWGVSKYEDVVQYPFGFGLSYTTFSWKVSRIYKNGDMDALVDNNTTVSEDDTITMLVTVTNTGDVAGQDVVELYYTPPYKEAGNGQIEQASVNLLAFGKTLKPVEPGKSADVELTFSVSDMASYDCYEAKIANGGYVLEKGAYQLSLRTDAHRLAGDKVVSSEFLRNDTLTLNIADNTQVMEESQNRFTGADTTDGVAIDGNSDGSAEITYLSRKDFAGTFPIEFGANRAMTEAIRQYNLFNTTWQSRWDNEWSADTGISTAFTFGTASPDYIVYETGTIDQDYLDEDGNLQTKKIDGLNELGMRLGLDYDDPDWENLLAHIPQSQMEYLVLHGYVQTAAVDAIGKPKTQDKDGPNQANSFSDGGNTTGFSSIALAQTWNLELAYSMGLTFGSECIANGIQGWYGPGVNVHRSPFGGRNYEYYSEDALMSGLMCAKVVSAAKNRGVFCYLKHICLYESESGRDGMYTWVTEQALREIYLRPFEIAVKRGGSNAIMTSYGRIGAMWTGGSKALLTEVCRDEWGFKGCFLTDYADHHDFMNGDQMIRAGGDLWMDGYNSNGAFTNSMKNTPAYTYALKNATKNVLYMWMNSQATNQDYNYKIAHGEINDNPVIPVAPELNFRWYIPVIVVVDVLLAAGAAVLIIFGVLRKDKPVLEAEGAENQNNVSPVEPVAPVEAPVTPETTETTEAPEATDTTDTPDTPNE